MPPYRVYREIWSGFNKYVYMYHVFHWLAQRNRHRNDFEADLWPETGDFNGALLSYLRPSDHGGRNT